MLFVFSLSFVSKELEQSLWVGKETGGQEAKKGWGQ